MMQLTARKWPAKTLAFIAAGAALAAFADTSALGQPGGALSVVSSISGHHQLSGDVRWVARVKGHPKEVRRVEFLIDGRRAWADTRAPYRFHGNGILDADRLEPGSHTLRVRALAPAGRVAATSSRVVVARPALDPGGTLFGVHMDATWDSPSRAQAAIAADSAILHPQIARNSLLWHMIEPTQGVRDWSATDAVVDELAAAGIEPMFAIYGSPSWANGIASSTPQAYLYVPPGGPAFDRWLASYADFVKAAVSRYKWAVHKWELWNEPNQYFTWKPQPDVQEYIRFYTTIRSAILSVDPTAEVAVGGLAGLVNGCCIKARDFLAQMIAAGAPLDYVAIHPYPSKQQAPDVHLAYQGNFDDIQTIRDFLDASGESATQLWVTEWGWPSDKVGLENQASYLTVSLDLLQSRYPYVKVAIVFLDHDRLPAYDEGLLYENLTPKPAGLAFARFVAGVDAAAVRKR